MSHKIRVLCLSVLFASLMTTSVFSQAERDDFSNLYGAAKTLRPGCKGDCVVQALIEIPECLDIPPCDPKYCTLNQIRTVKCASGDPGAHGTKCYTDTNTNDWWRRNVTRRQACDINQGEKKVWYGGSEGYVCAWSGGGGVYGKTPCTTPSCSTGPIVSTHNYAPRPLCAN